VILRSALFHTPRNPFHHSDAMEVFEDGALLIAGGKIAACGDYATVRHAHPSVPVRDLRGGVLVPGFIDTHVHFPQVRVVGAIGYSLLEWLQFNTLPEEAKFADPEYARMVAHEFIHALAAHGTTTALVFGAHFPQATAALFETARNIGLRIMSGLVLSDRMLLPELHQTPGAAYQGSKELIARFHGQGRLLYAVTPRFALSASEAILEICQTLMREHPGIHFQTHMNESPAEIAEVARLFPGAADYLAVYERFQLAGRASVFAHNLHTSDSELHRLAAHGSAVAHCPCSNAALGSGFFPMRRHLEAGVRFGMGTDVAGGTGFGMLKEGLQAYLLQRLAPNGMHLSAAQLLYLATRAGAEALHLEALTGDFEIGKAADIVYLRAPEDSPLAAVAKNAPNPERLLAAIFTLAGAESVREVWVDGLSLKECNSSPADGSKATTVRAT
jgi:guanine deaminase